MRFVIILGLMLCACAPHQWTNARYNPDGDVEQAKDECHYDAQRQMAIDNRNYGWSQTLVEGNVFRSCMRAKGYR